jgi:hypothetical protein
MTVADLIPLGAVRTSTPPAFEASALVAAAHAFRRPAFIVRDPQSGTVGVALEGDALSTRELNGHPTFPLLGSLPPLYPEWLGDRSFNEVHGTRFPYIAGAMANGIATTDLVIAMAEVGMIGFFGAGLGCPWSVEEALDTLTARLGDGALGHEPDPLAQRAGSRGGHRGPLHAARRAAGLGGGVHGSDAAHRALRVHGPAATARTAASSGRTTCSPRSAGPRRRGASWPAPASLDALVGKGQLTAKRPSWPARAGRRRRHRRVRLRRPHRQPAPHGGVPRHRRLRDELTRRARLHAAHPGGCCRRPRHALSIAAAFASARPMCSPAR